jgi:AraC-like DNA-binding protein
MFVQARTYIRTHLSEPDLSVGTLFGALRLPRCTLYRLFEHEGGIAAYIVHSRLRAAADDIANYPDLMLKDIAYGVGFNSASAFSRAFKREFGMTPHYLHEYTANQRAAPRNSGK